MKKYSRVWIIGLLSVLTIFVLLRLGNIELKAETLTKVNFGWFSLALLFFYISVVARGLRWRRILKTMGWPVKRGYAVILLTVGLFTSSVLPARAGDVARVAIIKQDYQIPVSKGIASIAAERALDVFAILAMALLGAWLALPGRIPTYVWQLMMTIGLLLLGGLVGLLVVPSLENFLREISLLKRIAPPKIWNFYQKVLDFGFSLIHGVRGLGQNPIALSLIIFESFVIWLYDAVLVYFILVSIGVTIPHSATLFVTMISDLSTAVPLTPGALGQFDAVMIGLLSLFGVAASGSTLATLLVRMVTLWTFIPVSGLITYAFGFSRALNLGRSDSPGPVVATPAPASIEAPVES